MDREKVIQGLDHCRIMCEGVSHNPCQGCMYQGKYDCADTLKTDALAMLKEHGKEPERVMRIIRETIHQAMFESEKGKDFEDFVCELIEHRIYHTNR